MTSLRETKLGSKSIAYYRYLCDQSFFHFVRIVGGHVRQGGVVTEPIHGILCDFITSGISNRCAVATPRDWLKSTVLTKWYAVWCYLQDQEERQLIAAENERLSSLMLKWIGKQFMTNDRLRQLYPDKLSYLHPVTGEWTLLDSYWAKTMTWSGSALELPRKGGWGEFAMTAIGIRGAAQGGHYTHIHIDDLVGEAAMESELIMEDVYRWFDNVNELLVNPDWTQKTASKVTVIGTHWGIGDFFSYMMGSYPEYHWRIVPCRKDESLEDKDNKQWVQHPDQLEGETNWPGSPFTTQYYVNMLNNPEKVAIYWAQHMNNPSKGSGFNKFQHAWLRFYHIQINSTGTWLVCENDDGTDGEAFRLCDIPLWGFIDPGGFAVEKRLTKGSRNAIVIGGQPSGSIKKFIIHASAFRFDKPSLFLEQIFLAHDKYKPRHWRIDTRGQQPYIYRDILEEKVRLKSTLTISPIKDSGQARSKDADIEALIGPVANGEWYIHRSMKDLIAEVTSFPHGMTKDMIDMWAKLAKAYITKGERADTMKRNLNSQRHRASQRDSVTGY